MLLGFKTVAKIAVFGFTIFFFYFGGILLAKEGQTQLNNHINVSAKSPIMHGLHKVIFDAYKNGEKSLKEDPDPVNYIHMNTGEGTIASMDFNQAGIEYFRKSMLESYTGVTANGTLFSISPKRLPEQIDRAEKLFIQGGTIQFIGFPGKSNPLILHPGRDIQHSYLEEKLELGTSSQLDFYKDKPISKLYSINPASGQKDKHVAWIIDLLHRDVGPSRLTLKKIIPTAHEKFPDYLVTTVLYSMYGERIIEEQKKISNKGLVLLPADVKDYKNQRKYFHRFHFTIDESGDLVEGKLRKFDDPLRIYSINTQ